MTGLTRTLRETPTGSLHPTKLLGVPRSSNWVVIPSEGHPTPEPWRDPTVCDRGLVYTSMSQDKGRMFLR